MQAIAGWAVTGLRKSGVTVLSDWDSGNDINMTATVAEANAYDVDAYISLHCDWNKAPTGTLPIIYPDSREGRRLAETVDAAYRRATGMPRRSIEEWDHYEVAYTNMPACIFETGSIRADIDDLKNAKLCGDAIGQGLANYFGVKYKGGTAQAAAKPAALADDFDWTTKNVQYFLYICNYGAPVIDGLLGPETEACIKRAQKEYGITVDGLWGPVTEGKASAQVKRYQKALKAAGYKLDVDGIAGPETFRAVQAFQKDHDLVVDGISGPNTFKKLMK
jgi:N-acetylmuramoyl-L-alanine amidase